MSSILGANPSAGRSTASRWAVLLSVCCMGVSALLTQLTLMRELLSAFSGNELVFGVALGCWLLLTGFGSLLGRLGPRLRRPLDVLIAAQIVVALAPVADVYFLRTLRNVVFIRGAAVGMTEIVASSLALLAPYCLVTGFLLTLVPLILADRDGPASIGQVYFLDTLGSILGGLGFSFALVYWLNHFGILYLPAALNLAAACAVAVVFRRGIMLLIAAASAAAWAGIALCYDLDAISTQAQFPGQEIVFQGNSPYGSLVVTETAGQYNFIENGVPLFSTHNIEQVEETVHYAMAQRPDAQRVLLVAGGVSGTAQEILKYGAAVDYVELDPLILEVGRRYLPENLADPRIEVINTDGRLFVRQTHRRYDAVLVDVPDPTTFQINRFYTREFFAEVKRVLNPDGVLSISIGHYENYLSKELAGLIAVAYRTLRQEFANVLILPAGRNFLLASNGPLTMEIAESLEKKGIRTLLVNRRHLPGILTDDRITDVRRAISEHAPINEDFNPILYYYRLLFWMSEFKVRFGVLEGALLALLGVALIRIRPTSLAILTTGLAASALEIVLLMAYQILFGCLYHRVALIVTMFMLGLGIGSLSMNRMLERRGRKDFTRLVFLVAGCAAMLPLVLGGLGKMTSGVVGPVLVQAAILLLTTGLGVLIGLAFPLAGKVDFDSVTSTAARIYTADYLGAALGALLVSTWLIPVLGVTAVCLLLAGLNLASGLVLVCTSRG